MKSLTKKKLKIGIVLFYFILRNLIKGLLLFIETFFIFVCYVVTRNLHRKRNYTYTGCYIICDVLKTNKKQTTYKLFEMI